MAIALYPGSFDPVTFGHVDVAARAAVIFQKVVVAVFEEPSKNILFKADERVEMFRQAVKSFPNIEVTSYRNLTVDFARSIGARVVVRGLRMNTDFEHEFEMALMNRKLAPDVDVVCLMTSLEHQYISSSLLKDIARLGGGISDFVPQHVATALEGRVRSLSDQAGQRKKGVILSKS